jgi:predicted Zn-dependent peptidase
MSSRLFQIIREKLGLAYPVYSYPNELYDPPARLRSNAGNRR